MRDEDVDWTERQATLGSHDLQSRDSQAETKVGNNFGVGKPKL